MIKIESAKKRGQLLHGNWPFLLTFTSGAAVISFELFILILAGAVLMAVVLHLLLEKRRHKNGHQDR